MQPLAALLRGGDGTGPAAVCGVCRLLHVLTCVRGHKVVVRFFPHEAADLERALGVLDGVRAAAASGAGGVGGGAAATGDADAALAAWEAQSVLLLWLSMLILTPFDLATVDSAVGEGCGGSGGVTPLAARIVNLGQGYLEHPGARRARKLACVRAHADRACAVAGRRRVPSARACKRAARAPARPQAPRARWRRCSLRAC